MAIHIDLQLIERTTGFRYPTSFDSMFDEFTSVVGTDGFRRSFPNTRLLLSAPEIAVASESTPATLFPFMRVQQPSWPDIYAFDLDSDGPEFRVVVWADHAVVMAWESFPVFMQWVRKDIAKHDTTS